MLKKNLERKRANLGDKSGWSAMGAEVGGKLDQKLKTMDERKEKSKSA